MLPPYDTEEVATAVMEAARARGRAPETLRVVADLPGRRWLIEARVPGGGTVRIRAPFAEKEGVLTPAELARELLEEMEGS